MGPYDDMTIAEIIHDYAVIRGDLTEQYARDQLVKIINERIEAARVTGVHESEAAGVTNATHLTVRINADCAAHLAAMLADGVSATEVVRQGIALHKWSVREEGVTRLVVELDEHKQRAEAAEVERDDMRAQRDRLLRGSRCPQCNAKEWNEADQQRIRADAAESRARDLEIERNLLRTTLAETLAMLQELDAAWNKDGAR